MPSDEMTIRTRDLRLARGSRTVLDRLNLNVRNGVTVVIGPNGAGKTTLLRALATLDAPVSGSIEALDASATSNRALPLLRPRIGYLAQTPEILPRMTVERNLAYVGWLHKIHSTAVQRRIDELSQALGLDELRRMAARKLSGGTRQRLGIAMAALHEPPILILDEPTAGVDTEHRAKFRTFIKQYAASRCVLIASHLHEDVRMLADDVIVLGRGSTMFTGTAAELIDQIGASTLANELPTETALRRLLDGAERG
jgi:ABC-2 type transport system ATP-binding protein